MYILTHAFIFSIQLSLTYSVPYVLCLTHALHPPSHTGCNYSVLEISKYGLNTHLRCDEHPEMGYRWWKSNDTCKQFSEHTACNGRQDCELMVDQTLGTYFDFCCTPSNVTEPINVTEEATKCFHINGE